MYKCKQHSNSYGNFELTHIFSRYRLINRIVLYFSAHTYDKENHPFVLDNGSDSETGDCEPGTCKWSGSKISLTFRWK